MFLRCYQQAEVFEGGYEKWLGYDRSLGSKLAFWGHNGEARRELKQKFHFR